ncbi:hypothetical protein FGE12_21175 [Aggregicoccus sp. 17bor-14]|uniref:hypothetical protein n=1 Tax=Myxococcaceae TaxID=31 RepID=UPI00129C7B3B|nr:MULTISPECIES: hypothetical protein [Myxococcaceae]MBF5044927.1 hypothetical protein [Simulacricoccus sp. 17bor-14]MRI90670.1 hypothetical protein [Aggregicoccus sp. 17bor-14]
MSLSLAIAALAAAASVFLLFQFSDRLLPGIAVVVSAVELLLRLDILRLDLRGVSLGLVLGAALAVVGAVMYFRVSSKAAVTAATCVLLVGALQLLGALRLVG